MSIFRTSVMGRKSQLPTIRRKIPYGSVSPGQVSLILVTVIFANIFAVATASDGVTLPVVEKPYYVTTTIFLRNLLSISLAITDHRGPLS
ncbi:hypothetical protein BIW11_02430 [Tropilaelaps mercedesae]|uniref:Uncharacterized protein n=1 Tax=Tropilaelaps mercedesae TaxID=418985 RepID=A0A1V9Y3C8_9ACAR|nr:hypothetical protein BIW11_02430 [Tropilaelaps mercedesae]